MKILILAGGKTISSEENEGYPLLLAEFGEKPLIEELVSKCRNIPRAKIIIAISKDNIAHFQLDAVIKLLGEDISVIPIESQTQGATCSALLAVDELALDEPLLILNGNEIIDVNFNDVIEEFAERSLDAGLITFDSIHPRYSYVRLDSDSFVIEASEKRPISRNATTGFYWFKKCGDFIDAAKEQIRNEQSVEDKYYVCPTLNPLVLKGKSIGVTRIESSLYHPLKTDKQISNFENLVR